MFPAPAPDTGPVLSRQAVEPVQEEESQEYRERPRRKSRKRQKTGSLSLLLGVAVLGAILLLVAGGGVAFYWFWNAEKNSGGGKEDPVAYLPADSSMIIGVDFGTLLEQPGIGPLLEQSIRQKQKGGSNLFTDCKQKTGLEFKELFDHTIVAYRGPLAQANVAAMPPAVVILQSKVPFDQRKIRDSMKNPESRKLDGKTYYRVQEHPFQTLFMPSDRIMIMTSMIDAQVEPVIRADGAQPLLSPDVLALVRRSQRSHLWFVVPFDDSMRQNLERQAPKVAGQMAELKPFLHALAGARGMSLSVTIEGDRVRVTAAIMCAEETSAQNAAGSLETFWTKQTKGLGGLQLGLGMAMLPPSAQTFAKEVIDTAQFTREGNTVLATAQVSMKSLQDLLRDAQNRGGGMRPGPGFPAGPPGGFPGAPPPFPPPEPPEE